MTPTQVYAKFRLSVDNGFRNEFSFVDYRKWGQVESWSGARLAGIPPVRSTSEACIEVWFNWNLVGTHRSYASAEAQIAEILRTCPVDLGELLQYLQISCQ